MMKKPNIELVRTGIASPEAYDVYLDGKKRGYLMLTGGLFTASLSSDSGESEVYYDYPDGVEEFYDDERDHYMKHAVHAILVCCGGRAKPAAPHVNYTILKG